MLSIQIPQSYEGITWVTNPFRTLIYSDALASHLYDFLMSRFNEGKLPECMTKNVISVVSLGFGAITFCALTAISHMQFQRMTSTQRASFSAFEAPNVVIDLIAAVLASTATFHGVERSSLIRRMVRPISVLYPAFLASCLVAIGIAGTMFGCAKLNEISIRSRA